MSSIDNQYLRPEEPLITDAKKSPLALLAMTCSNIGADVIGNSKPSTYEKSTNKRSKSQESAESDKINANSTDSNHSPVSNHSHSDTHLIHHQPRQRSPSSASSGKSSGQISFKPYEDVSSAKKMRSSDQIKCDKGRERFSPSRSSSGSSTTKETSMNRSSSSSSTITNNISTSSSSSNHNVSKNHDQSQTPSTSASSSSTYNQLESDLLKSSGHLTAAYANLVSQQLKSSHQVCRDPFCTGCQMSSPFSAPGQCCNGLRACIHQNPFASAYASSLGLSNPHMSSHLAAASRYQNGLSAGLGRPYVCGWSAGGMYCGKTFTASDELLQHLKSHTSSSNYSNSPMSNHGMSALGHYPHLNPMITPPMGGLRTAFDPTNRYHPYKPFGLQLAQLGANFNPSLPSLPPHHPAATAAAAAAVGLNPWRDFGPHFKK